MAMGCDTPLQRYGRADLWHGRNGVAGAQQCDIRATVWPWRNGVTLAHQAVVLAQHCGIRATVCVSRETLRPWPNSVTFLQQRVARGQQCGPRVTLWRKCHTPPGRGIPPGVLAYADPRTRYPAHQNVQRNVPP